MGTKLFGILASAAIVAVIALTAINYGNYRSLLPERVAEVEQTVEQTVEEVTAVEADTTIVEQIDSLALTLPADTLQK